MSLLSPACKSCKYLGFDVFGAGDILRGAGYRRCGYNYLCSKEKEKLMKDDILKNVKEDTGKPRLSLVPIPGMWEAIARVREYGDKKYPDKDNWKKVARSRWWDAYLRHTAACANNPQAVDEESGLPHAWHAACNLMFCLELDRLERIDSFPKMDSSTILSEFQNASNN